MQAHNDNAGAVSPYANDALGCVYRFVRAHIHDLNTPPLSENQILRSWQSLATAPPLDEYCVLAHLSTIRHGSNYYQYDFKNPINEKGIKQTSTLLEHSIQVDFFGVDTNGSGSAARHRASLLEMLINSTDANDLFADLNPEFGCLYADDVMHFAEVDERRRIRERHSITIHLSQTLKHNTAQRYMDSVIIRSISADNLLNNEV